MLVWSTFMVAKEDAREGGWIEMRVWFNGRGVEMDADAEMASRAVQEVKRMQAAEIRER